MTCADLIASNAPQRPARCAVRRRARRAGALLAAVAAASGCAGAVAPRAEGGADARPATLAVEGATFTVVAAPQPGAPGALAVARDGAPLHYSDGALAFRVAAAHCAGIGRRLRGTVDDGHRPDGTWLLRGGCA